MVKYKKWRFFAGLIILFAGLDVTLLLSHMSRFIGLFLLVIGVLVIISSNEIWKKRFLSLFPERVVIYTTPPQLIYIQKIVLFLLTGLTVYIFFFRIYFLMYVIILFIVSELLLLYYSRQRYKKNHLLVTIEFQLFVFFSIFTYSNFEELFAYKNTPKVFSLILFVFFWALEIIYLYCNCIGRKKVEKEVEKKVEEKGEPLSEKFIYYISLKGRLKKHFTFIGLILIIAVILFNLRYENRLELGSHDWVTLLLASVLIMYNHIPERYATERDLAFIFLIFVFLILIVPITYIYYFMGGMEENSNSPVIYYLLAKPTSDLLNLMGINANSFRTGSAVMLNVESKALEGTGSNMLRTSIALSCTGLYSVSIFISAFISFVLVHFSRFNKKLAGFFALGIFTSWVANILRLTLIYIAGYYYGVQALLWTHHNAGIFIFMAWIALFWGLMFKYFDIPVRVS